MTTKMAGVHAQDSPVTPDLSVLAEQLVAAAHPQGAELDIMLDLELSDGAGRVADPGRSP